MMMRKGVLLVELIVSLALWMIIIPILVLGGINMIKTITKIRGHLSQSHERGYAFQRYLVDLQFCEDIFLEATKLTCRYTGKEIHYACKKKALWRQENGQSMYLSHYWNLENCEFHYQNKTVVFQADSTQTRIEWPFPTSPAQRVHDDRVSDTTDGATARTNEPTP